MNQVIEYFDRISEAPAAIPRLRRFILDLAVRGKLVEQDPNDEPASELLKRIQAGRALVENGDGKLTKSLKSDPASEIPFTIPSGWEVVRLGWLAHKLGAGSTPLGGKTVYQAEGVAFGCARRTLQRWTSPGRRRAHLARDTRKNVGDACSSSRHSAEHYRCIDRQVCDCA